YSRQWSFSMFALSIATCTLARFAAFQLLRWLRSSGRNLKTVILVDAGGKAAQRLNDERALRENGYHIARSISFREGEEWLAELVALVELKRAHEVWLCLPLVAGDSIKQVLHALRHH